MLLPVLGRFVKTESTVESILVLTVAVAILQALHAYPVAGSQTYWSTVAMFLPCAIVVGLALHRSSEWKHLTANDSHDRNDLGQRVSVVGFGLSPIGIWHDYLASPKLGLPGTSLIRLDPATTATLQQTTSFLTQHCDTFYSVPPSDDFYFFTKIPSPTGLTVSNSGIFNATEELEIAAALNTAQAQGKRACVMHEANGYPGWQASTTGQGPLGVEVSSFTQQIGVIGTTIWTRGSGG